MTTAPFAPALNEVVLFASQEVTWLHFRDPVQVIETGTVADVLEALSVVATQVEREGRYAAGFLSYEAAPAFDKAFRVVVDPDRPLPLLWFGIYNVPERIPHEALAGYTARLPQDWQAEIDVGHYHGAIARVKDHIARGDTYQVNYTYRLRAEFADQPWPAFAALAYAQAPPYAAYIETEGWAVCSASPELFFRLEGELLSSRPMKGTASRGRGQEEDGSQADWLYHSEKNRAENVMIVDMVRNDMGRIAWIGGVDVPALFTIEKYPTVWQMTSTVTARTEAGLEGIMGALFPAASITGAPKVRTMQIIADLETSPRRIYTGAIGYMAPGRVAQFNVAIRTWLVDKQRKAAEYGIGGGIVWDSQPEEEWQETITKARILREPPQAFALLETLRWTPEAGWFLLEEHLDRLASSADYFGFPCDPADVRAQLESLQGEFGGLPRRVRLTLDRWGQAHFEAGPLPETPAISRLALAKAPVDAAERFLYHKTTRRALYERALAGQPGYDDVVLWNEQGEVTETCIANLVVELDGRWYTPPVSCGLLPGTHRRRLLAEGKIAERVIRVEELRDCERVWLVNAVRGMWEGKVYEWGLRNWRQ
jgi:para-aminobenzoate synthetase / 4-amino-4-deoxychorismate lyase